MSRLNKTEEIIELDKYYLVGFNEYVNSLRQYRVDKITNLAIADEYFEKDIKFCRNFVTTLFLFIKKNH